MGAVARLLLALVATGCASTTGRFLHQPNCDLYYEVAGSGPPVVLVHGAADLRIFDPVVGRLAKRLTVIRYDQRGYGRTRVHDGAPPTTLATDVADLDRLRAALGFRQVHVLALSNGGPIAIEHARTHSHAVDRLVLVDTYADNHARTEMAWPLVREVLSDPERIQGLKEIAENKRLDKTGRLDSLAHIEAPTLVICGERDRITPLKHSRQMAARLPNGRLAVIAGTGHLAFAEKPGEFVRLVRTFLLGNPQRPPL